MADRRKRPAKPRGFTFNDLKNVVDGPGRRGVPLTPDQVGRGDRLITAEEERALMRISASVMEGALDDKITTRDQFAAELGKLMTDPVVIVLLGKPVPGTKARTKFRWIPKNQQHAMDQIKLAASDVMRDRPMLEGPLRLRLVAEMPIPTAFSKKRRAEAILGAVLPTVTPDLKNIVWLAEDAMKSVVYADDKLICQHITEKRYSEKPKLSIVVECIDTDAILRASQMVPQLRLVAAKKCGIM